MNASAAMAELVPVRRDDGLERHDPEVGVEPPEVGWIAGDDCVAALASVEDDAGVDGIARASLAA